ncbi:MAG: hypothetical protein WAV09_02900 [Minisyncoccia bacterium]
MNQNIRTITLSISLALAAGAFTATHALASDDAGNKIAVGFQANTNINTFGNIDPSTAVVTDESKAVGAMAHFFGPTPKQVLVRKYSEYNALKQAAIKAGVTSPERIAQTEVIVVPELAAMFGVNDIDQYGIDRGLVTREERSIGGLTYNDKLLTSVCTDIMARAARDELKPVSGDVNQGLA